TVLALCTIGLSTFIACSFLERDKDQNSWKQFRGNNRDGASIASVIHDSWKDNDPELLWKKNIGKELRRGMYLNQVLIHLNNNKISEYMDLLNNPKSLTIINDIGDIDYPSRLIHPILKAVPAIMKSFPYALLKSFL
ncbi:MAG: hypothetical protein KKG04_07845, partial [Candidatus Thermoplasmatota archaeon]|nr:hypothetical protein [Candidatus Thermoplasmatota archaeon]